MYALTEVFCVLVVKNDDKFLLHRTVPAMEFRLISHLPVGAGLGSSAAFSVCIASVLLQHAGKISRVHSKLFEASCTGPGDSDIQGNLPLAGWSPDEKLAINKWAFLGEKIIHGHPSGIDNSISSLGIKYCSSCKGELFCLVNFKKQNSIVLTFP